MKVTLPPEEKKYGNNNKKNILKEFFYGAKLYDIKYVSYN